MLHISSVQPAFSFSKRVFENERDEAHSGVSWQGLHNCSNGCTTLWSIRLISCQPSAMCSCSSRDECLWKSRAWFKYRHYLLKDKCSLPTSVLLFTNWCVQAFLLLSGWEAACCFSPARPLLVVQINAPPTLTVMLWLRCLCLIVFILCQVAGFSQTIFNTSSPYDSFITTCHCADDGPYWVCGCYGVCIQGWKKETGINVTIAERQAMIWIWFVLFAPTQDGLQRI